MRSVIAGTAIASAAILAVGMTGVAAAETPPAAGTSSASPPSVSVEGVATVPLSQGASAATATAAYRQAMANAETDGHEKAEFLASKAGTSLGAVLNIAEGGGEISCTGGSEEGGYAEYNGEQPDFGETSTVSPTPLERAASSPSTGKPVVKHRHNRKRKHRKASAKRASAASSSAAVSCTLSAHVALVYTLG